MHKAGDWREVGGERRDGPKGMGLSPLSLHFFCSLIDPSLVIVQGRQAWPSHKSPPLVGSSSRVKEPVQSAARRVAAEIRQVHGHPPQPLQSSRPYFSALPLTSPRASPLATLSSLRPLFTTELRLDRLGQEKDDHGR